VNAIRSLNISEISNIEATDLSEGKMFQRENILFLCALLFRAAKRP